MDISIVVRKNIEQWGGDVGVIKDLKIGFEAIGATVEVTSEVGNNNANKKYLLTNSCLDLRAVADFLYKTKVSYFILPFHEDFLGYFRRCYGFFAAVKSIINNEKYVEADITLSDLETNPELCEYFPIGVPMHGYFNKSVLSNAGCIFPNSNKEEKTILRDAPLAKTKIVRLPTREVGRKLLEGDEQQFLKLFDLNPGYIIQVGRMEPRKNQLATILASRNIPNTLVLIATSGYNKTYEIMVIKAILKFRKYPTLIVSQNIKNTDIGLLRIRQMPNAEKLSWSMLGSAYLNASVNCHPAFYELPGLTYMESLSLGVPTIISKMATIDEYIKTNSADVFVDPANINEISDKLNKMLSEPANFILALKDHGLEDFCNSIYMGLSEKY